MDKSQYKGIFVFAEQRHGKIQNVAYELLGKARDLADPTGQKVYALLFGNKIAAEAKLLVAAGADEVLVVEYPALETYTTEPYAQALAHLMDKYKPEIVLIGATTIGRDLGPRLSARTVTGLTADCTKLEISAETGDLLMTRPAFGGNLMATIICTEHRPQMATVRPGVMKRREKDEKRAGNIVTETIPFQRDLFKVKVLKEELAKGDKVDITEARILVSGGRGVGSKEGFQKLENLAKVIGAQVSSSRAMVDAGVMPHDRQVGQTGKTVRPACYFACGISGAIQHLAGMEESEYIIAINKDKDAPIFGVADLGIVGDLHKILPLLTERLEKLRKEK